jgi:hypothetical protein
MRGRRGTSLVEVLVGTALALVVLSVLTAAVGLGGRLVVFAGARGEAEDTAQLAIKRSPSTRVVPDGIGRSRRRPGRQADAGQLTFAADLDGDGAVDAASEETTARVRARRATALAHHRAPVAAARGGAVALRLPLISTRPGSRSRCRRAGSMPPVARASARSPST